MLSFLFLGVLSFDRIPEGFSQIRLWMKRNRKRKNAWKKEYEKKETEAWPESSFRGPSCFYAVEPWHSFSSLVEILICSKRNRKPARLLGLNADTLKTPNLCEQFTQIFFTCWSSDIADVDCWTNSISWSRSGRHRSSGSRRESSFWLTKSSFANIWGIKFCHFNMQEISSSEIEGLTYQQDRKQENWKRKKRLQRKDSVQTVASRKRSLCIFWCIKLNEGVFLSCRAGVQMSRYQSRIKTEN